jgi:hypothetical protein
MTAGKQREGQDPGTRAHPQGSISSGIKPHFLKVLPSNNYISCNWDFSTLPCFDISDLKHNTFGNNLPGYPTNDSQNSKARSLSYLDQIQKDTQVSILLRSEYVRVEHFRVWRGPRTLGPHRSHEEGLRSRSWLQNKMITPRNSHMPDRILALCMQSLVLTKTLVGLGYKQAKWVSESWSNITNLTVIEGRLELGQSGWWQSL